MLNSVWLTVRIRRTVNVYGLLLLAFSLLPFQLSAQTVATYDFEDGTADGWISLFGASTRAATNAAAYTGAYSLLTSTSSTGTGGPSILLNSVLALDCK
jgi:endo-1,4-beta-xylanase